MRSALVLPSVLHHPRISARGWLALAAGIGCAVCAYAGLYPRFDDGKLRIVLALTSAPFGAAVVAASLEARNAARAFVLTLCLAGVLGVASIILPSAILALQHRPSEFLAGLFFGFFFGAPTGVLYGIPLAVLTAYGHRHVRTQTHESTDRAARVAGIWLFFIALVGLAGWHVLDTPRMDYDAGVLVGPSPVPAVVACLAALGGVLSIARATRRLRSRTAWVERVRAGLEPAFRLRPADVRDDVEALPRVGDGTTVIEWCPDDTGENTAYRMAASGTAVALIEDRA